MGRKGNAMIKTADFLDLLQIFYGVTSDYGVARRLSWSDATVANYRHNRAFFSAQRIAQVSGALHIEPEFVGACMHEVKAARAGDLATARIWRDARIRLGRRKENTLPGKRRAAKPRAARPARATLAKNQQAAA